MKYSVQTLLVIALLLPVLELSAHWSPSIKSGDVFRADFRLKLQADTRTLNPRPRSGNGAFDMHQVRLGINGRVLRHFQYEAEYEFREAFGGREFKHPLRDAFVNFDYLEDLQFQFGKFKLPFSQEQNTGTTKLDFVMRSRIADNLAPGRDIGAMLHGKFMKRALGYEIGIFKRDGENAEPAGNGAAGGRTFAARVTGKPLRLVRGPRSLENIEIAAAVTSNDVPEGLANLQGESYSGKAIFHPLYTKGNRLRIGADFNWTTDVFSLKSEYIAVHQQRNGQGVRSTELPEVVTKGWYVAGVWNVLDDDLQIVGRYDEIGFASTFHSGLSSRSPRAPNILENSDRAWTFGVNWFPTHNLKIQINGVREKFQDPKRSPMDGPDRFWIGIMRVQFVL